MWSGQLFGQMLMTINQNHSFHVISPHFTKHFLFLPDHPFPEIPHQNPHGTTRQVGSPLGTSAKRPYGANSWASLDPMWRSSPAHILDRYRTVYHTYPFKCREAMWRSSPAHIRCTYHTLRITHNPLNAGKQSHTSCMYLYQYTFQFHVNK